MKLQRCLAAAGFALALGTLQMGSAFADDAMKGDGMMIDCANANDMMMKMMGPHDAMMAPHDNGMMMMKPDASVDHNFMASTHMMMEHQKMLAKIELKCGRSEKARAAAQKMLDDIATYTAQEMDIIHEVP